jgi:ATP-dependent Lhr-like helicase
VVTGGRSLGELEEWFLSQLSIGDTFRFAGEVLRFEGLDEFGALATRTFDSDPMVPSYEGGKFPLSTYLAERVREILSSPAKWKTLPFQVQDWLASSAEIGIRGPQMLVETFPGREAYPCATPCRAPVNKPLSLLTRT